MAPHPVQVRRPHSRSISSFWSTSRESTNRISFPSSFVTRSSAWACGIVRGNPSRMNPFAQSAAASRSLTMPMTTSSGTSPPASMNPLAFFPSSVPFFTASRSMSPVEIWGMENSPVSFFACVPFPAPGGPRRMIPIIVLSPPSLHLSLFQEPLVMAGDQVRFDLLDRVHCDSDDDQEARPTEIEGDVEPGDEDAREDADDSHVEGAPQR